MSIPSRDVSSPTDISTSERAAIPDLLDRANQGLAEVDRATATLVAAVCRMDDGLLRGPSLLPGWSRGHVISHLARNADALTNLLTWARTGVEHQAYTSRADRDAAIEEGARRTWRVLTEDLAAACERFTQEGRRMPAFAWESVITGPKGGALPAYLVPWLRMQEVWIHHVDLAHEVDWSHIPDSSLLAMLERVIGGYGRKPAVPAFRLTVELADTRRSWRLGTGEEPVEISGPPAVALAWLTGRGSGEGLRGALPGLPAWEH
ncbi:maleylpyruvate isomerase family mycothiol-dependent enzyme [Pseudonocardiaceae bacterium YIM PH 21723]|nr:maleylpyruvate isomerase family mycothiol-dependent enzyme [Pseudonocardiaceae bacterium YIM PH 21723]